MEICRLCLEDTDEDADNYSFENIFELLLKLFPFTKYPITSTAYICESCIENAESSYKYINTINKSDLKIKKCLKISKSATLDINTIHEKLETLPLEMRDCITVCRLCLDLIPQSKIFLFNNDSNILHYTLLISMLKFCTISVNLKITDKPSMCLKCWENLQITFSFIKSYAQTERQIEMYCRRFYLRSPVIDKHFLLKIKDFFENTRIQHSDEDEEDEDIQHTEDMSRIKIEHNYYICDLLPEKNNSLQQTLLKNPAVPYKRGRQARQFSKEEDIALLTSFFKSTEEGGSNNSSWKKILSTWRQMCPNRSMTVAILKYRLSKLLAGKSQSELKLEMKNKTENTKISTNQEHNTAINDSSTETTSIQKLTMFENVIKTEQFSDSEDFFLEATTSSFTPHAKTEPLSDSDTEIDIESQIERFSTEDCWGSIPQLERMDIPLMNIRIENIYSIDDKRKEFNSMINNKSLDSDIVLEEVKTCKRILCKNLGNEELYKCMQCNFETTNHKGAVKHAKWHNGKRRKFYRCKKCPYKISNGLKLKLHEKIHRENGDIPVLQPANI